MIFKEVTSFNSFKTCYRLKDWFLTTDFVVLNELKYLKLLQSSKQVYQIFGLFAMYTFGLNLNSVWYVYA